MRAEDAEGLAWAVIGAHLAGRIGKESGLSTHANPCLLNSPEWFAWRIGWEGHGAKKESER